MAVKLIQQRMVAIRRGGECQETLGASLPLRVTNARIELGVPVSAVQLVCSLQAITLFDRPDRTCVDSAHNGRRDSPGVGEIPCLNLADKIKEFLCESARL
ncbi:hypothetical protein D3C73_1238640 [compost metagenome]